MLLKTDVIMTQIYKFKNVLLLIYNDILFRCKKIHLQHVSKEDNDERHHKDISSRTVRQLPLIKESNMKHKFQNGIFFTCKTKTNPFMCLGCLKET